MAKWLKTTREDLDDFLKIDPPPTREDAMDFVAKRVLDSGWMVNGSVVMPDTMNEQPYDTMPHARQATLLVEKGGAIVAKSNDGTQTIARQNLDGSIRFNEVKTLDQLVLNTGKDPVTSLGADGSSIQKERSIALTSYHALPATIGNMLFNFGLTGQTIQTPAAPTQPTGGWILVHNVGVEDALSSAGNVDLKAVADKAGFSYTRRNNPKIEELENGVKALKAWDIYIYSGHGTSRGNIVAYGPPPTGSKYAASLLNEYTIVPPADLPSLMKMGDPKHDLHPNTMPVMCFFDACYVDPVNFPKIFIDAGSQVVTHPRGRGESIASVAKGATEAYFDALLAQGKTFKEALKASNDIIDAYNQTLMGKLKPMTPYFTTYSAGVTEDSKFKDLKRP
jgi:hypothetical protein